MFMRHSIAALITAAGLCHAQPPLEFEVASVKPAAPQTGDTFTVRMGGDKALQRFSNVTLRDLITRAYSIKDYQLIAPAWVRENLYDVTAKMPPGATQKDVPKMLQKLLADRFRLSIRRETKDLPIYALLVSKRGPKTEAPDAKDAPKTLADGTVTMRGSTVSENHIDLYGAPMTLDDLAELLSGAVDRPVLDFTGLKGEFQFKMQWTGSEDSTIFTALPQSLGLKLEARKAPLESLIVEHAEKIPVEN